MGVASARARNEVPRLRVRSSRAGDGRKGHWSARFQDVTEAVIAGLSAAYRENAPEFIYFLTLYNIFHEFLEDVSEDELPNEATGFRESQIWQMLYSFQRDAMLAIVGKLEKFNGCILADSVGLGKTLTALAVVKYYESRNKTVLVLCRRFNAETDDGRQMEAVSTLLGKAVESIVAVKAESDIDSLFTAGGTSALLGEVSGLDDFELICFLVVKEGAR